MFEQMKAKKV
jgi:hypothetical protein